MGTLHYATTDESIALPDRLLAHLKVVVTTKLRRNESFTLTWIDSRSKGGRSTIWLQPSIPLRFVFDSAVPESLNARILNEMAIQASGTAGLSVDVSTPIPEAGTLTPTAMGAVA